MRDCCQTNPLTIEERIVQAAGFADREHLKIKEVELTKHHFQELQQEMGHRFSNPLCTVYGYIDIVEGIK